MNTCIICLSITHNNNDININNCGHNVCYLCLYKYIKKKILLNDFNMKCIKCEKSLNHNIIINVLNTHNKILERYYIANTKNNSSNTSICPSRFCGYINSNVSIESYIKCNKCKYEYCQYCRVDYHYNKSCTEYVSSGGYIKIDPTQNLFRCKKCNNDNIIDYDDNMIICNKCNERFCNSCKNYISYGHFNYGNCDRYNYSNDFNCDEYNMNDIWDPSYLY